MKPIIITFFMKNVYQATLDHQKKVVDKFNKSGIPLAQIYTEFRHGASIDMVLRSDDPKFTSHDTFIILDIDCIPLHDHALDHLAEWAYGGNLIGNIQRSNHIENGQHLFVAPNGMAISREVYEDLGKPSFLETPRSDVAEELTWLAEEKDIPITMLDVLGYESSPAEGGTWALKDGMPVYGRGTTYGIHRPLGTDTAMFWHAFQIFHAGQQRRFVNKCREILGEDPL